MSRLRSQLAPASARLRELQERLDAETRVSIVHRDELGPAFALERASFTLDDAGDDARPGGGGRDEAVVLERRVEAGGHRVSAELVYRVGVPGAARRLEVRSSHAFEVEPGSATRVVLVTHERAGPGAAEERAAVRFEVQREDDPAGEGAPSGGPGAHP